jgi:YVTN family beta-propeller protein
MNTSFYWKKGLIIIGMILVLAALPGPTAQFALAEAGPPLLFIENVGQFPNAPDGEALRFLVAGGQATLAFTDQALWLTMMEPSGDDPAIPFNESATTELAGSQSADTPQHGVTLKLTFLDANPHPRLEPFNRQETRISYFTGNDPAQWRNDVPVWGGVRYVDLYPGLDLEVSGENGQLVQRLVVKEEVAIAGVSYPDNIRWQVEGVDALSLENGHQLRLNTTIGDVSLPLPQTVDGNGVPLELSVSPEINGLEITNPFSPAGSEPVSSPELPVQIAAMSDLLFSTYLGGSSSEDSQGIGVDGAGNVYVTGRTVSADFPTTPGALDPDLTGIHEIYVAKFNPTGTALEYATYLGGTSSEFPYDLAVDEAGQAYVAGVTHSSDFPVTPGAYDPTLAGSSDVFVVKLNPTGTALEYATYLGSSDRDDGYSLAIDGAGSAYVTGMTLGTDFPTTPDAFQSAAGGGANDAFAAKLDPNGSTLVYGTYLGGSSTDQAWGIAVDAEGNAYLTGKTESSDFPVTPGAFQTDFRRIFVTKLNPAGRDLVYGTFLGGNGYENGWAIAVDESGQAYVAGETTSSNFPTTPGAFQPTYHAGSSVTREGDAFVVKFNSAGNGLVYGTFIGGFDRELGFDLTLDPLGQAYVTGVTYSVDFPTTAAAIQPTPPGYPDAFVAKLNAAGSALAYGTYLGSSFGDVGYAIAADGLGQAYVTGFTNWSDFPTTSDAFDPSYNNGQDAYVTKLATGNEPEPPPPPPVPTHTCAPTPLGTITVGNEPRGIAVDSARQRVYVANYSSDSVSVIDSNTNTVLDTISGLTTANGLALDPLHNVLWVTNHSTDQVTPIQVNDEATAFTPLPALAVGASPWGVTYDPLHDYVYVANSLSNSVTVIEAESRTVVTTITGSFHLPFHLAANPVTGQVYVVNFGGPSVVVLNGTTVSKVIDLYDSQEPYGLAIDESRNLVYVATVEPHRIVVIGPANGQPDQFLGWGAFHRGFGNPNRPVPLRVIAVNPGLGPAGDGGHLWATTTLADGGESNQALLIPKGWGGYFHFPLAQDIDTYPADGLAIDRATNRVYIASGFVPGTVTVIGDHADLCADAFTKIASLEEGADQDPDQIGVEIWEQNRTGTPARGDVNGDGRVNMLDLAYVASRFGSSTPAADLNGDGKVDIFDLVIIADNYGRDRPATD